MEMSIIARTFTFRLEHRVYFTRGVLNASNSLLQTILAEP